MDKNSIANELLDSFLNEKNYSQWKSISGTISEVNIFNNDEPDTKFLDGYVILGRYDKFIAVGKYIDKYYTDSDNSFDQQDYFISFGMVQVEDKEIPVPEKVTTVKRKDFNSIESRKNLKNLYEDLTIKLSGADNPVDFLDAFD